MLKTLALAALMATAIGTHADAQALKAGTYVTFLGPEDQFNSSGERLLSASAIVAQDRANYHRFGIRHPLDHGDPWFRRPGTRLAIPDLVVMSSRTANLIVSKGALVAVSVFMDTAGQITSLRVQIPG